LRAWPKPLGAPDIIAVVLIDLWIAVSRCPTSTQGGVCQLLVMNMEAVPKPSVDRNFRSAPPAFKGALSHWSSVFPTVSWGRGRFVELIPQRNTTTSMLPAFVEHEPCETQAAQRSRKVVQTFFRLHDFIHIPTSYTRNLPESTPILNKLAISFITAQNFISLRWAQNFNN